MAAGGVSSQSVAALASINPKDVGDLLLKVRPNRASGSIIGKAFLETQSDRLGINQIVHGLISTLDLPVGHIFDLSPSELHMRLKTRISDDFRLGQTRHVEGWVLSETETWLCALTALRHHQ